MFIEQSIKLLQHLMICSLKNMLNVLKDSFSAHLPSYLNSRSVCIHNEASKSLAG